MFFREEIAEFQHAYFENIYNLLDTEKGMRHFCRDVFVRTKGIVPDLDKDALGYITLDLEHRYIFDTKYKIDRWGFVQVPRGLIDEYAGRILAKAVVYRGPQVEEEAQRQAEVSRRVEELRKVIEERARRLAEALLIAEACLRLREEETALTEPGVSFSSLAEVVEGIDAKGRDLFVADLAMNYANCCTGIHDYGVIYVVICLIDLSVYVGQTIDFDARVYSHLGARGNVPLAKAVDKHGREKFVCVKLLAGIKQQEELNSVEIAVIGFLWALAPPT